MKSNLNPIYLIEGGIAQKLGQQVATGVAKGNVLRGGGQIVKGFSGQQGAQMVRRGMMHNTGREISQQIAAFKQSGTRTADEILAYRNSLLKKSFNPVTTTKTGAVKIGDEGLRLAKAKTELKNGAATLNKPVNNGGVVSTGGNARQTTGLNAQQFQQKRLQEIQKQQFEQRAARDHQLRLQKAQQLRTQKATVEARKQKFQAGYQKGKVIGGKIARGVGYTAAGLGATAVAAPIAGAAYLASDK